jgi:hypothetical protein
MSTLCLIFGGLSLLCGAGLLVFGVVTIAHSASAGPGAVSFFGIALTLMFSSLGWFVIAKVITLLEQIAANTRK